MGEFPLLILLGLYHLVNNYSYLWLLVQFIRAGPMVAHLSHATDLVVVQP